MNDGAIAGLILLALLGVAFMTKPRGIRNNNPGNIEFSPANNWRGQVSDDGRYAVFSEPVWGIRAMAKLLRNYQSRYGLTTVREIVTRWAPPEENLTEAYIMSVTARTGFNENENLDLTDKATLHKLIDAIIYHENGQQPYPDGVILSALDLL